GAAGRQEGRRAALFAFEIVRVSKEVAACKLLAASNSCLESKQDAAAKLPSSSLCMIKIPFIGRDQVKHKWLNPTSFLAVTMMMMLIKLVIMAPSTKDNNTKH
ncbi:unnamed protein product, partial [Heterosigma akashiwo]